MTVNKHGYEVPPIFQAMQDSFLDFRLTGSRYFGLNNPNDHDYFVQIGSGVNEELTRLGFEQDHDEEWSYADFNTAAVWLYWGSIPIHIQITKDAQLKAKAQAIIKMFMLPIYMKLEKHQRRSVWESAYMLAKTNLNLEVD